MYDISSVQKYKKGLLFCKNIIYPEWKPHQQVSFLRTKVVPSFRLIILIIWNLSHFTHFEKPKNVIHLAKITVEIIFICLSIFCNVAWMWYFPFYFVLPLLFTLPLCTGILFSVSFIVLFTCFIWSWFDFFWLCFILSETSSVKTWFVLATGLADQLIHIWCFANPSRFKDVRIQL